MKGYFTLSRVSELEPHHQKQFSVIPNILIFWTLHKGYGHRILYSVDREDIYKWSFVTENFLYPTVFYIVAGSLKIGIIFEEFIAFLII